MNRTISLATIAVILLVILGFLIINKGKANPLQIQCESDNGVYMIASENCLDYCPQLKKTPKNCSTKFVKTCDCGPNKCWDGEKCVNDSDYMNGL